MEKYPFFKNRGRLRRPSKIQNSNPLLPKTNFPKPNSLTELPARRNAEEDVAESKLMHGEDAEAARIEAPNNQWKAIYLILTTRIGQWHSSK